MDKIEIGMDNKHEYNIQKRRLYNYKIPFFVGIGDDFQEIVFLKLKAPARRLFATLIKKRDIDTNIAKHVVKGNTEQCELTKAYNELKKHNIVHRIKKQTYLLNPLAVIPRTGYFDKIKDEWDSI